MKRKKILALLLALSMLLPLLPVTTFAADVTDIYVNSETGADTAAGTSTAPVKTLAKAYEKVSDGGTIYITSDITLDNESIFNINRDKAITIASVDSSKIYTIGDNGSATTINNNAIILLNITAGKVTLKNVTIDGTNSLGSSGTGVNEFLVMVQNAELILDSGATVQNGKAGGILATNSKLTLNDGATVTANTKGYFSVDASSYKYAGGIGVTNGSTFVMNGGKITGNSTQSDGSGINISGNSNGSAVINGGEISGNSSSSGGALNLDADSSLTINGGTIQNNTVTAGSSTDGAVNIKGALTIGGGDTPLVITDNKGGTEACNLRIADGVVIQRETNKTLADGSKIGVSPQTWPSAVGKKTQILVSATESEAGYFVSDNPEKANILYSEGSVYIDYDSHSTAHYTVEFTELPEGVSAQGTLKQTVEENTAISEIVLSATSDEYRNLGETQAALLNTELADTGLTATADVTAHTITISGTPTKNVTVYLKNTFNTKLKKSYNVLVWSEPLAEDKSYNVPRYGEITAKMLNGETKGSDDKTVSYFAGGTITAELNTTALTNLSNCGSLIDKYDVIVIDAIQYDYSDDGRAAIAPPLRAFLQAGGRLIFLNDYSATNGFAYNGNRISSLMSTLGGVSGVIWRDSYRRYTASFNDNSNVKINTETDIYNSGTNAGKELKYDGSSIKFGLTPFIAGCGTRDDVKNPSKTQTLATIESNYDGYTGQTCNIVRDIFAYKGRITMLMDIDFFGTGHVKDNAVTDDERTAGYDLWGRIIANAVENVETVNDGSNPNATNFKLTIADAPTGLSVSSTSQKVEENAAMKLVVLKAEDGYADLTEAQATALNSTINSDGFTATYSADDKTITIDNTKTTADKTISLAGITMTRICDLNFGTAPEGMTVTGDLTQTDVAGNMTDIVLKADTGYRALTSDQATKINDAISSAGLKAEYNDTDKTITISGTPTADVNVDLSAIVTMTEERNYKVLIWSTGLYSGTDTAMTALDTLIKNDTVKGIAQADSITTDVYKSTEEYKTAHNGNDMTAGDLAKYDLVIVFLPNAQFSEAQMTAIKEYVNAGGSVVLQGTYTDSNTHTQPGYNVDSNMNTLVSGYLGNSFKFDLNGTYTKQDATINGSAPIFDGYMSAETITRKADTTSGNVGYTRVCTISSITSDVKRVIYGKTNSSGDVNAVVYVPCGKGSVTAMGEYSFWNATMNDTSKKAADEVWGYILKNARKITDNLTYTVDLGTAPAEVTTTGGDLKQENIKKGTAISDIVIAPEEGYSLTNVHVKKLQKALDDGDSGLTATLDDGKITISGTPKADIAINLSELLTFTSGGGSDTSVSYKVTFTISDEGVDQTVSDVQIKENTNVTLPGGLTKTGYTFKGWTLDGDESGKVYAGGSMYTVTQAIGFTAVFTEDAKPTTYNVTFDTDRAAETVENISGVVKDTYITLPSGLTKSGYTFNGWTVDGDTKVYAPGSTYKVTGEVKFTAKFTAIPTADAVTVTFTATDADQTVAKRTVEKGTEITLPGGLTQKNATFKGWTVKDATPKTVYAPGSTYTVTDAVEFEAVFETAKTYKVTFNTSEAKEAVSNIDNAAENSYITLPMGLTKDNHIFKGWKIGNDEKIYAGGSAYKVTADVEFTAEFEEIAAPTTYDVTFKADDAEQTVSDITEVEAGTAITLPSGLTKSGWTFKGWKVGDTVYAGGTTYTVTDNVTFTAEFTQDPTPVLYTVTFTDESGTTTQELTNISPNAIITMPTAEKDNYTFDGWVNGDKTYKAGTSFQVTDNVTFKAKFTEIPAVDTYEVTFTATDADQTVAKRTVEKGTEITLPGGLTKKNATFKGWTVKDATPKTVYAPGSTYTVTDAVEFVAEFETAKTYTVTLNNNGAKETVSNIENVAENSYVTLPMGLTKDNHIFKGWKIGDDEKIYAGGSAYKVTANVEFTAEFEEIKAPTTYDVTFEADDAEQTVSNITGVEAGTAITLPSGLTKSGATFKGWKTGDKVYAGGTTYTVTDNVKFTAEFTQDPTPVLYTVTFTDESGTTTQELTNISPNAIITMPTAEKDNYTFDGWVNGDKTYKAGTSFQVTDNVTFKAKFTEIPAVDTYEVTFTATDADQTVAKRTVEKGTEITLPGGLTKKNATFKGWTVDGDTKVYAPGSTYTVNAKTEFTANFEDAVTYNVTFNTSEAKEAVSNIDNAAENSYITLPMGLTKDNHIFKGWKIGDDEKIYAGGSAYKVTANVEFTAEFEEIKAPTTFDVTFDKNGAEQEVSDITGVAADTYITLPSGLTKENATFKGWRIGNDTKIYAGGSSYKVTETVKFTAVFDDVAKYQVSYDLNGGTSTAPEATEYMTGSIVTAAAVPERAGYIFNGWLLSYGNMIINANGTFTMPATDVTLTAQWSAAVSDGGAYIPAVSPEDGEHTKAYSYQLTARKADASDEKIISGVKFVLVDKDGNALDGNELGHGLAMDDKGLISGTVNGAGEITFNVRLANYDNEWVSPVRTLTIKIAKTDGNASVTIDGWTYGETASTPVPVSETNGTDNVTYYYKAKTAEDSEYTTDVPVNAGEYTVKAVFAATDNYPEISETDDFEIAKAEIKSVDPTVTAPVAGEAVQTAIENGDGYTGEIAWTPADATFAHNTAYTAKVTLTADDNHVFTKDTTAAEGWTVSLDGEKLTLTKEYDKTVKDKVLSPVISPNGGTFRTGQAVTITCATDGATIYYTTDKTTPTADSKKYEGEFTITADTTITAIAIKDDYINSDSVSAVFTKRSTGGGGGGGSSSGGSGTSSYVVVFDSDNGTQASELTASANSTVAEPATPTKEGYVFDGWYTDKELTKPYDFTSKVSKNITLYAKWSKADSTNGDTTGGSKLMQMILTIDKKEAQVFGVEKVNDVAPEITNDRTMLPARFVAENLGATVDWDGEKQLVTIVGKNEKNEDIKILLTIGSDTAKVNGEDIKLDSPAYIKNDRTFTPIRFISEKLGATVEWKDETRQVVITKLLTDSSAE